MHCDPSSQTNSFDSPDRVKPTIKVNKNIIMSSLEIFDETFKSCYVNLHVRHPYSVHKHSFTVPEFAFCFLYERKQQINEITRNRKPFYVRFLPVYRRRLFSQNIIAYIQQEKAAKDWNTILKKSKCLCRRIQPLSSAGELPWFFDFHRPFDYPDFSVINQTARSGKLRSANTAVSRKVVLQTRKCLRDNVESYYG